MTRLIEQIRVAAKIADKLTQKYEGWATIVINRDEYDKMAKALIAIDNLCKEWEYDTVSRKNFKEEIRKILEAV